MESDEMRLMEIIERMPDNLTDMQKVRYLYVEVCRFFVYNPEYITGTDEKRAELFDEEIDLNEITNNKAICSKLSRALAYLLQACGIESNCVYFNGSQEGHMETIFRVDDSIYELDAARDLMNIKMGFKTQGFAFPMKPRLSQNFIEYSHLSESEIEELDKAIGYTFGLSKEYLNAIDERGESKEDFDFKMYMDEAVDEIGDALHNHKMFKEYLESVHPEENVDFLSAYENDKYRIEFVMNYVNNFANNYEYIDKRDFFESMIARAIESNAGEIKLFNGTDKTGEMCTILKYDGKIAENDLFYFIKNGQNIRALSFDEVNDILNDGFKTIAKGKEQFILSKDAPFQKLSYEYGQEINEYIMSAENSSETEERENQVFAVLLIQRLRKAMSDYKEKIYCFAKKNGTYSNDDIQAAFKCEPCNGLDDPDIIGKLVCPLFNSFVSQVKKYGYAGFFEDEDLKVESPTAIHHFLSNMQKLEQILEEQAGFVMDIIENYKVALKEEAVFNNMMLYHVSSKSPEQMHGRLKPNWAKTQFHQNFEEVLCASTENVDTNPYIMSRANRGGMRKLPIGINSYLLAGNNVSIEKDDTGDYKAISKFPGYIYYMPINEFEPMVMLGYNDDTGEYFFEFGQEWTINHEVKIPRAAHVYIGERGNTKFVPDDVETEVYAVEQYTDVTSILEHNQIAMIVDLNAEEIVRLSSYKHDNNMDFQSIIRNIIRAGKVRYLNGEADINAYKDLMLDMSNPTIVYDAKKIIAESQTISAEGIKKQKTNIREFFENAISSGIEYGDYVEIMNRGKCMESDNHDSEQR